MITSPPATPRSPLIAPITRPRKNPEAILGIAERGNRPKGATEEKDSTIITLPSASSKAKTARFNARGESRRSQPTPAYAPSTAPHASASVSYRKGTRLAVLSVYRRVGSAASSVSRLIAKLTGIAVFSGSLSVPARYGSRNSAPPSPTTPPARPTMNPMNTCRVIRPGECSNRPQYQSTPTLPAGGSCADACPVIAPTPARPSAWSVHR